MTERAATTGVTNGSGNGSWCRAVRLAEGLGAVLSLLFVLGTPLLSLHDQVNRIDHTVQVQSGVIEAMQKTHKRQDATIQLLSERLTRIETKLDSLHEQIVQAGARRNWFGDSTEP